MCLIIQKPKGVEIPEALMKRTFAQNKDGWGIMASVKGKLVVSKGFGYDKLIGAIEKLSTRSDVDIVIHLRYATSGKVDLENCHPFRIGPDVAMAHNGVLNDISRVDDTTKSDTWHLGKEMKQIFGESLPELVANENFKSEFEAYTTGSRLIVMTKEGTVTRYHNEEWVEFEGLYLSNDWSLPTKATNYRDNRSGSGASRCSTTYGCGYSDWEGWEQRDLVYQSQVNNTITQFLLKHNDKIDAYKSDRLGYLVKPKGSDIWKDFWMWRREILEAENESKKDVGSSAEASAASGTPEEADEENEDPELDDFIIAYTQLFKDEILGEDGEVDDESLIYLQEQATTDYYDLVEAIEDAKDCINTIKHLQAWRKDVPAFLKREQIRLARELSEMLKAWGGPWIVPQSKLKDLNEILPEAKGQEAPATNIIDVDLTKEIDKHLEQEIVSEKTP